MSSEGAGFVEDEGERVDEEFGVVGRKERFEHCDEAVHGERLREEALVVDNNVEDLPKDDERLVVGLGAVEVGGLERFLEDRVRKCGKPMGVRRSSSSLRDVGVCRRWGGAH